MRRRLLFSRACLLYFCCALLVFAGLPEGLGSSKAYASTVSKLVLSTNSITLSVEDSQTLTATAIYDSGSTDDVTTLTDWSSGDTSIATVYNGTIVGIKEGTVVVTATYMTKTVVVNVTVKKKVRSLTKSKSTVDLRVGGTEQLDLVATYSDNSTENVNNLAEWSIDNDTVATISNGLITALSAGQATITATYGNKKVTTAVNVDIARRLDLGESSIDLRLNGTNQLKLNATFEDGTIVDIADKAEWTTSDGTVADAVKGLVTGYGSGTATIIAKYGTKSTSVTVNVELAKRLDVSKDELAMKVNASEQLKLNATFADDTVVDVTSKATWTSSNEDVASVTDGKISAYTVGQAIITAKYGSKTSTITVNVGVPKTLTASSSKLLLKKGDNSKVTITATYTDGTTDDVTNKVTWTSDAEDMAFASDGTVYALASGQANLTAVYGGKKTVIQVDVDTTRSVSLSSSTVSLKTGDTKQLTLTVTYTDGTTKDVSADATWTSDAMDVVTVEDSGHLTALKTGQATVKAKYGSQSAVATVQVDNVKKLSASETDIFLSASGSKSITLTAYFDDSTSLDVTSKATWTSDKENVAYVTNGTIHASSTGSATITGSYGDKSVTISVDVAVARNLTLDKKTLSLRSGNTSTLMATATYADGNTADVTSTAVWTSSDESVLYVSKGGIRAYKAGEAVVTVKYGEKSTTITVQVDAASTLKASVEKYVMQPGDTKIITLTATYDNGVTEDVTSSAVWSVKDATVATVSNGQVTAVARGATTVTAKFGVKSVNITISVGEITNLTVSDKKVALADGGTKQVSLTVTFKDGTSKVVTDDAVWTTSSSSITTVNGGLIQAVNSGKATITATYGEQKATISVEVNIAQTLTANKRNLILKKGDTFQLTLTMKNSSDVSEDVTNKAEWAVVSTKIADISSAGLLTTYEQGKTTVTGKYGGKTVSIPLEVDVASKLVLSKKSLILKSNQSQTVTVTATFSDGSTRDVTADADWTTSKADVADVDSGTITASSSGKVTIKAQFGGKTVSLPVEVDKLKYLKANTTRVTLAADSTQQITLTATYSDGTVGDVTASAVWTSSNEKAVDVKDGQITGVYKGISLVTGKFAGKTVTIFVVVS